MSTSSRASPGQRLVSLDAFRGFVMLALVSQNFGMGLLLGEWGRQQSQHAPWAGVTVWDLIQPAFMIIVGVAMAFSYTSRKARGDSQAQLLRHAITRAATLVLLGVFLRSDGHEMTQWTFEDVLSQIGLGYVFVFVTLGRGLRVQVSVTVTILVAYFGLFALWPPPQTDFAPFSPDSGESWAFFSGFSAHWNKAANPSGYFDRWFLNLFPRTEPWSFHPGGYGTLNFVPSMATMMVGVMAGEWIRNCEAGRMHAQFARIAGVGAVCVVFGLAVDGHLWPGVASPWTIAPVVKRLWTPSFVIYSAGWTLLALAGFYWLVEVRGLRRWCVPLVVVGINPLAMYVMHTLGSGWIRGSLATHLYPLLALGRLGHVLQAGLVVVVLWCVLYWMSRRNIIVRI